MLFLRVLIQQGLADGALNDSGGLWRWHGPTAIGPSLRELIGTRLDRLSDEQRAAMEVVAIAEPITVSALEGVVAAGAIDGLERDALVEVRREGARRVVRVGHPLYGEVLRARTPTGRTDAVRVAIADAIETTGMRRVDDVLRVASFRVDGGAPTRPELLVRAARRAWSMHDTHLVEQLVTAALAAGPNVEASYLLGETYAGRHRYDEAVAIWDTLLDADCDDMLLARIAAGGASVLALTSNRAAEAEEFLARAERRVTSPDAKSRLAATRAALFVHSRPAAEQRGITDALLAAADTSDEAQAWAWVASARLRLNVGEFESVLAESDAIEVFAQRARQDWPMSTMFVSICRFYALLSVGRLDDADALSRAGLELALGDAMALGRILWSEALAIVALGRGHLDEAELHLNEIVPLLRPADNGGLRPVLCELGMLHALRGDTEAAAAALEEAAAAVVGILEPFVYPERVQATALAARGNVSARARNPARTHGVGPRRGTALLRGAGAPRPRALRRGRRCDRPSHRAAPDVRGCGPPPLRRAGPGPDRLRRRRADGGRPARSPSSGSTSTRPSRPLPGPPPTRPAVPAPTRPRRPASRPSTPPGAAAPARTSWRPARRSPSSASGSGRSPSSPAAGSPTPRSPSGCSCRSAQ